MRQQINLYRGNLIDRPKPLQSRQAGFVLLIVFLLVSLFTGFSYWQFSGSQQRLAALVEQHKSLSVRVNELEKQYPEPQENAILKANIRRVEMEIQGQRQASSYFVDKDNSSNTAILTSLEELARHPYRGLWLRHVRMLQQGEQVELAGSALEAKQIPEYLQMIGDKNIFAGKMFAQLKLKRVEERNKRIDFTLGSTR
jgi:Tfp pilus assembly protein PilN